MHIQEEKARLRAETLQKIKAMTDTDFQAESRSISKHIIQLFPQPKQVCAYYPLPTEVDIRPALAAYLQTGVEVYLPFFTDNDFTFKKIDSLQTLSKGKLGIQEPLRNAAELQTVTSETVVLMPGRCFSRKRERLGRGNGGYDTWIEKLAIKPQLVGIAFECQMYNELPQEPHDQMLDMIVNARKVFK